MFIISNWSYTGAILSLGEYTQNTVSATRNIIIGFGCVYHGVVLHELGHAIGFYHEHNRPDRDDYIDVIYDSIKEDYVFAFRRKQPGSVNTLGLGYDFRSIMHYGRRTFSRDGSDTIRPKVQTSIGNRQQLSPLDIAKANRLYNCPNGKIPSKLYSSQ